MSNVNNILSKCCNMHSITVLGVQQTGSKYNGQCHHAPTGSFIAEILMEKILIYN